MCRAAPGSPPLRAAATASQCGDGAGLNRTAGRSGRAGAAAATSVRGATCTKVGGWCGQPRSRSAASTGAAYGSGTLTFGGRPWSAYHSATASIARSSDMPGSPIGRTEFARPVQPPPARRRHSPSRAVTGAGQPASEANSTATTSAALGRRRAGTRLARCTSGSGTRTGPRLVATVRWVPVSSVNSPSASEYSGRPSRCPTTRRTTTRWPMS
jgi:hypothetical protein